MFPNEIFVLVEKLDLKRPCMIYLGMVWGTAEIALWHPWAPLGHPRSSSEALLVSYVAPWRMVTETV